MKSGIRASIHNHRDLIEKIEDVLVDGINRFAESMIEAVRSGKKIFWCGNGGSAADSQHLAAELIGRFKRERMAIASLALTTDTSILTCVGNDYGFEEIFVRQIQALGSEGDILVCISTSGNSENVCRAAHHANESGISTFGLLGNDGGKLKGLCRHSIVIPDHDTARIQEMHILCGHILCDMIEQSITGESG